jgi:hypothetical protein
MFQITIHLTDDEATALQELADSQMRMPSKQAHWMLRRLLLKQRVEAASENCDITYDNDDDWVGNN